MSFGNLPDLKVFLGINEADTQEDTPLSNLLLQVSSMIEDWCDRPFTEGIKTYVEVYSGNGSAFLVLNNRPVLVSGLIVNADDNAFYGSENGAWSSSTLLTYGVDYCLQVDKDLNTSQSGILQSINGFWDVPFSYMPTVIYPLIMQPPYGWGNLRISYQAGYASLPNSLYLALYGEIASVRSGRNYGQLLGSESFSDGAGSASYNTKKDSAVGWLTRETTAILTKYRNIACA